MADQSSKSHKIQACREYMNECPHDGYGSSNEHQVEIGQCKKLTKSFSFDKYEKWPTKEEVTPISKLPAEHKTTTIGQKSKNNTSKASPSRYLKERTMKESTKYLKITGRNSLTDYEALIEDVEEGTQRYYLRSLNCKNNFLDLAKDT